MGIFILLLVVCAVIIVAFQGKNITDEGGTPIEFHIDPLTKLGLWILFGVFVSIILTFIYLIITEM